MKRTTCTRCNGSGVIDWGDYGVEDCGVCDGDGDILDQSDNSQGETATNLTCPV